MTQHDTCGSWSFLPIITQQPIFRGGPLLPQWRRAKTRVLGSSFALATEPSPVPRHQTRGSQYVIKEFIPNNLTSMAIFWRFSYIQIKRNAHLFVKPCFISSGEICFYLKWRNMFLSQGHVLLYPLHCFQMLQLQHKKE